jgi:hypothetical protein
LPPDLVPRSEAVGRAPMEAARSVDADFISSVVERWRGAMISNRTRSDDSSLEVDSLASAEFSLLHQAARAAERPVPPPSGLAARPDAYFFPVEDTPNGPAPRLRK